MAQYTAKEFKFVNDLAIEISKRIADDFHLPKDECDDVAKQTAQSVLKRVKDQLEFDEIAKTLLGE